jgi:multiple sugar transport system permease protein
MSDAVAQKRPTGLNILIYGFIIFWVVLAAFPFLWTVWGSFKVEVDFFSRESWWNAIFGTNTQRQTGVPFTGSGYYGAWVTREFWRAVGNTAIVTLCVTVISLTLGTLGGYALARSGQRYAFWILIAALVFRAMPHITLVSGYLLPFFQLNIWGVLPTSIIVLVAINQPFTLWMLHSFFLSIPKDLDESAMVDGCTRFQAFRMVIIPVMWPGVVTTGLFSFLYAAKLRQPDHGAQDFELSRHCARSGQCHVCRGGSGVGNGPPLYPRAVFPTPDRQRIDRRRSERLTSWPRSVSRTFPSAGAISSASTTSTSTSPTKSSWCCWGHRAAARPRPCG